MSKLRADDQHSTTYTVDRWKSVPFEQAIEKVTYTTKIQRSEFLSEGAYPIVSQEEGLINGYWNHSADVFRTARPLTAFGDHTQTLKYVDFDFVLGADGVKLLQAKTFLLPKFFHYQLQAFTLKSLGYARHYRLLKEKQIVYPSLPEQERIVALLDEAFEAISTSAINAKTNIQKAQAVFDSLLANTFGRRASHWRTEAVSKVAKHNLGKMLDKAKNRGTLNPYLRNLNVRWFEFDLSDLNEMPFLPEEVARYSIVKGDVVICEGGDPGRAAIWPNDDSIYFQKALHRVRFTNPMLSKWFVYYLYSQHRMGLLKQWFTGSGIAHFTGEALARFEFPIPPDDELRVILDQFDKVRQITLDLETLYQRKIAAIEELEESLLERAFSANL
jgi:type I restriction enzyme S subunit